MWSCKVQARPRRPKDRQRSQQTHCNTTLRKYWTSTKGRCKSSKVILSESVPSSTLAAPGEVPDYLILSSGLFIGVALGTEAKTRPAFAPSGTDPSHLTRNYIPPLNDSISLRPRYTSVSFRPFHRRISFSSDAITLLALSVPYIPLSSAQAGTHPPHRLRDPTVQGTPLLKPALSYSAARLVTIKGTYNHVADDDTSYAYARSPPR